MIYAILIGGVALVVIAKLFAAQTSTAPGYLLSTDDLTSKWTSDNNWAARFSLLFFPLIFVYNLFAWMVFGLEAVYSGFMKLVALLWSGLVWLWNEVARPTVVWLLQMIWHYPIVFTWRFFHNAFEGIRAALKTDSIVFSAKRLFALVGLSSLVLVAALLAGNVMYAAIGLPIVYLFLVYSVMKTLANDEATGFKHEWIWPVVKKLAIYLVYALVIVGALAALTYYNDITIVSGLGLTLSELLVPIGLGFSIALAAAVSCVPAFVKEEGGSLDLLPLLRMLVFRMPKLLFGAPFQLIGAAVVSIVPVILLVVLNYSAGRVTGTDVEGWTEKVQDMGVHIPAMLDNSAQIERLELGFLDFEAAMQAKIDSNNTVLEALRIDSASVQQEIAAIPVDRLHTHDGDFYVNESQFFSMPVVDDAASYKLVIDNMDSETVVERYVRVAEEAESVLANWKWNTAGSCNVYIIPVNACGEGEGLSCSVNVLDQEKGKQWIGRPFGPSEVCSGDEVSYTTQNGFERYEWSVPEGVDIIEKTGSILKVVWGDHSGTVRVRGFNDEDEPTLWIGRDVVAFNLPGEEAYAGGFEPDEQNERISIERPFLFKTKEAGVDSLQRITAAIAGLMADNESNHAAWTAEQERVEAESALLSASTIDHLWALLAKLLAVLGLVLLSSVVFAPLWHYSTGYNYRLVAFHQEGEHYWEKLFREMRERNAVQPYLGWFVLAAVSAAVYYLTNTDVLAMILP